MLIFELMQYLESIWLSLLFGADESSPWYIYYCKFNIVVWIICAFASKLAFAFAYREWRDSVSAFWNIHIALVTPWKCTLVRSLFSHSLVWCVCLFNHNLWMQCARSKSKGVPGEPLRQINNALSRRIRSLAAAGVLITPIIHRTGGGGVFALCEIAKVQTIRPPERALMEISEWLESSSAFAPSSNLFSLNFYKCVDWFCWFKGSLA